MGHHPNLGHEALLRRAQNNFMNLLITTSSVPVAAWSKA